MLFTRAMEAEHLSLPSSCGLVIVDDGRKHPRLMLVGQTSGVVDLFENRKSFTGVNCPFLSI